MSAVNPNLDIANQSPRKGIAGHLGNFVGKVTALMPTQEELDNANILGTADSHKAEDVVINGVAGDLRGPAALRANALIKSPEQFPRHKF